ncbi:MAG TPA: HAMP domain-containing sensor histidine kinase [Propioniciclava sp.]|uniref:sensor histidine kinase n=1 Tax=Propioniciclava sp. TaxID=2038686 RepID=UPI002C4E26C0|nr:HAMP domain-containing sensor histidine kinase [Propioniciclava sp.]HRL49005.1 HAMP domain-containing sensor histidine kinase [Propioniciclava sp.]HRL80502.1 HAMP domain-containing sensor histidine kinase [Propioniciclava sp.]
MKRIRAFFSSANRSLQQRLAIAIAIAIATAVAVTGVAAYALTLVTVYNQLDAELVDVANITSGALAEDLENMGGIDTSTWRAANVIVMLVRSDNHTIAMPGRQVTLELGPDELTVARTSQGWSSRTGVNSAGGLTRIVAVPLVDQQQHYALVVGRPLAPTLAILQTTGLSLLVFGGVGAAIAAAIGYVIAKSGLQPIRQLSDAVLSIAATNKLTPVEIRGDDEIADLGQTFNRMLKALESSRERQRRLIADAGHELRTPLTSMRTNVELLVADERQGMLPDGARSEILRDVAAQLGEFTQLVGDLVQLSREETVQPAPEAVDLREIIHHALDRVKRRGPGLSWRVRLDPLYLVGEPDALERAVTNLLDNAVKFSPAGGTITVELIGDRLRVADEGPGIADEDLPHVFERFYRSEHARATTGSGLGLSIVAQTIQAHGGWVKAGHAPEGGAELIARLPGSPIPPEEQEADQDEDAAPF